MMLSRSGKVTDEIILEVEARAEAHQRSIMRRLLGLPVRGRVAQRIDRTLAEYGLGPLAQGTERGETAA